MMKFLNVVTSGFVAAVSAAGRGAGTVAPSAGTARMGLGAGS